jgi:hypothetical protein
MLAATGPDDAAITPTVNAFRADLGSLNANVTGSFGSGSGADLFETFFTNVGLSNVIGLDSASAGNSCYFRPASTIPS